MKTIFDQTTRDELISRINMLNEQSTAQLRRNTPTLPELRVTENGAVSAERAKWIALIEEYGHFSNFDFVHPFFGRMTKEQIGYLAYKHTDHHLRQFNS